MFSTTCSPREDTQKINDFLVVKLIRLGGNQLFFLLQNKKNKNHEGLKRGHLNGSITKKKQYFFCVSSIRQEYRDMLIMEKGIVLYYPGRGKMSATDLYESGINETRIKSLLGIN